VRAVIFANGTFHNAQQAPSLLRDDDLIVAVNGGTRHAWAAGVDPQVIVGDLDSLTEEETDRLRRAGVELLTFPPRKDQTDLEIALHHVVSEGADAILILAALGGRLDQTVANILLMTLPELDDCDVRVVHDGQEAFVIRDTAQVGGRPGDTVSLIPIGGDAVGVTTSGLEYALDEETLKFGPARGVSNVLAENSAEVHVRQGLLLCVVTRLSEH
jgi:thiamine pyrophosphokinase